MIESLKSEIVKLLRDGGEDVSDDDSFTFARIGEGRGFSSLLWSVRIGTNEYAVKVTDTVSRVEEIAMMVSLEENQKADFARLFGEQHNRELEVYEWFKDRGCSEIPRFFAGSACEGGKPGIIIIENFARESTLAPEEGLNLDTVFNIVDTICGYQAAANYPHTEPIELIPKDLFFEMASPTYKKCVEQVAKKGWMNDEWKSALLSWCEIPELRRIQMEREEGDPHLTLAHCDLWANNMIFARNGNDLHILAIVDWQCAAVGNPLLDLSSVVGINMNADERRLHERIILEEYVDLINEKCDYTYFRPRQSPVDFEQAAKLYRRGLKFAAIQLSLALGTHCKEETQERVFTARLKAILEDVVG